MLCELIIELGYISLLLSQLHDKDLEQFTPIILGEPNENIVQNHLSIALLNVFWYLNGRYRHIFIP